METVQLSCYIHFSDTLMLFFTKMPTQLLSCPLELPNSRVLHVQPQGHICISAELLERQGRKHHDLTRVWSVTGEGGLNFCIYEYKNEGAKIIGTRQGHICIVPAEQ